jgi:hypothetical protein
MPSMADPYSKLSWAKKHLATLEREVTSFCTTPSKAYTVSRVPAEAFCEIKALQPYHRGDDFKSHPLWRLDEMCNLDKHRRIPAHGTALEGTIYGVSPKDVIKEATDECLTISIPLAMKNKMRFEPAATVEVAFGGDISGITETLGSIVHIYNFIALAVLPRFDRFFP